MSRVSLRLAVGALLGISMLAPVSARASGTDAVIPWSGSQPVAMAVEGGHLSAVQDSGSGRTVTTLDAGPSVSSPVWPTPDAHEVPAGTGRVVTDGTVTAWGDLSPSQSRSSNGWPTAWTWRGPDGTTHTHAEDHSGYGPPTAVSGRWLLLDDRAVVDGSAPSAPPVLSFPNTQLALQDGVVYIPGGALGGRHPGGVVRKDLETGASDRIDVPGCYGAGRVRVAGSWMLVGCYDGHTYLVDLSGHRATRHLSGYPGYDDLEELGNGYVVRADRTNDGTPRLLYALLSEQDLGWYSLGTTAEPGTLGFTPYAFSRGPVPTVAWFDTTGAGHLTRLPVETSPLPAHPTGRYLTEAPSNLTAAAQDSASEISWSLPPGIDPSRITGFVFRGDGADRQLPADQRQYQVFPMENGVRRTFSVAALTDEGEGLSASITTASAARPQSPLAVTATPGDGSAVVRWVAPPEGDSPITGYTVQASSVTDPYTGIARPSITLDGTSRSATVRGLQNGTAYTIRVWAHNAQGRGPEPGVVGGVVPRPDPVQEAPRSVRITAGDRRVDVSWQPPTHDGGGISSYTVTLSNGTTRTVGPAVRSVTFAPLVNGAAVSGRVQAVSLLGASPVATTTSATPAAPPAVMRAPRVVAARRSAVLSWTRPAANGAPLTVYEVQPSRGGGYQVGGTTTRSIRSNLPRGAVVRFRMRAKNRAGAAAFSAWSAPVRVR